MTSLTLWMGAPRFGENEAKKERESMSFDEMSRALQDVWGSPPPSPLDDDKCVDGLGKSHENDDDRPLTKRRVASSSCSCSDDEIRQFDDAIAAIPVEERGALRRAQEERPEEVGPTEKALFIRTNKSGNIADAAQKMCKHWEARLSFFGSDKAFLPMTLNGALKEDWEALTEADVMHYIPGVEDLHGRALMYVTPRRYSPKHHSPASVARAMWYMHDAASYRKGEEEDQRRLPSCMVLVVNTRHAELFNSERKIVRHVYSMHELFPMTLRAHHLVSPPWFHHLVHPVIKKFHSPDVRAREVIHKGTPEEVLKSLASYGIRPSDLPLEFGGTNDYNIVEWLEKRRSNGL